MSDTTRKGGLFHLVSTHALLLLTVALIVLFSFLMPRTFPTMLTVQSILSDKAVIAFLALAEMVVISANQFDLSTGFGVSVLAERILPDNVRRIGPRAGLPFELSGGRHRAVGGERRGAAPPGARPGSLRPRAVCPPPPPNTHTHSRPWPAGGRRTAASLVSRLRSRRPVGPGPKSGPIPVPKWGRAGPYHVPGAPSESHLVIHPSPRSCRPGHLPGSLPGR